MTEEAGIIRTLLDEIRLLRRGQVRVPERQGFPLSAEDMGLPTGWFASAPSTGQTLYRLVRNDPPRARDFKSKRDKNLPRHPDEQSVHHCGLSMFREPAQALSRAYRYPQIVAEVTLEGGIGISLARTFSSGHYTVWGDPQDLCERSRVIAHQKEPG